MKVVNINMRMLAISLFILITVHLYIAVNDEAFAATSNTVELKEFTFSCLESGEPFTYNKHGYFVGSLGAPVFCGNHGKPSPIGDNLGDSGTLEMNECNDEQIRKILYYGYKGPREWSGFNEEQHNGVYNCWQLQQKYKWCGNAVTAMALTMTQQTENTYVVAGLKPFLKYVADMPNPPDEFVSYYMGGDDGQQKLFTWIDNSKGYLKIEKVIANPEVGHNLSLENGCYEVYSHSSLKEKYKVSTLWSKNDGTTEAIPLSPGKYYVKEVIPPKGYAWDFVTHEVDVKEDETTVVESYNYLQTVRLILHKIDYTLKDERPRTVTSLSGAVYGIYLDEHLTEKVDEIETDQYGTGMLENLLPNKYYIKELKAPKGFTLNEEIIEVYANAFSQDDVSLDYYIDCYDYPIITSFAKCYKDESGIQKGLEGAKLQLLTMEGDVVDEWISEVEPHQIKYLSAGKYILREAEAPFGYAKSEDIIVEVLETSEVQYYYLENERQRVQISFVKELEKDPYALLPKNFGSTIFGIFDEEDNLLAEITIEADGMGKYIGQLPEGQYYLKELQAEEGYILSQQVYGFEVSYDDSGKEIIEININDGLSIINEYVKCSITLDKRDKDTGEKLEDVGFTLYDSNGKEIAEAFTDNNGQIIFENLPIGEYYVRETKPKEGYFCTGEMHSVLLTSETSECILSFTNEKIIVEDESSGGGSPEDIVVDPKPTEPEAQPELQPELEQPEKEPEQNQEPPKEDVVGGKPLVQQIPVVEIPKTGDINGMAVMSQMMLCILALGAAFYIAKNSRKHKKYL